MSNPDQLAKLKSKVEVYEAELRETMDTLGKNPQNSDQLQQTLWTAALVRFFELSGKLLNAYREYTKELERLAPR